MYASVTVKPSQLAYVDGGVVVPLDFYIHDRSDMSRMMRAILHNRFGQITMSNYRLITYDAPNPDRTGDLNRSVVEFLSSGEEAGLECYNLLAVPHDINMFAFGRNPHG